MSDLIKKIDACLPQTQCGLCGYKGCLPYAEDLAKSNAPINLCPPGGVPGLMTLSQLLEVDPTPYLPDMQKKAKPPTRAVIREAECIGCTKCIQACPVDAIIGSAKLMHTVLSSECTGCELCIAPCPVDCIDMVQVPSDTDKKDYYRKRYQARAQRLNRQKKTTRNPSTPSQSIDKKAYIAAAIARTKEKKKPFL